VGKESTAAATPVASSTAFEVVEGLTKAAGSRAPLTISVSSMIWLVASFD
jgi:hypothetical protein